MHYFETEPGINGVDMYLSTMQLGMLSNRFRVQVNLHGISNLISAFPVHAPLVWY